MITFYSTENELMFQKDFAIKTGILFDRVYSGKSAMAMMKHIRKHSTEGNILIHTGGIHSLSDSRSGSFIHASFSNE